MASKNDNKPKRSPTPTKEPRKVEAKAPAESANRGLDLTIVGIGASAGGLLALKSFFATMPVNTGMAFVVVVHLHPEHESHMAELLQRQTTMPTIQVTEKIKVEPNHVYVIPPNRTILLTDTHLDAVEYREPSDRRTPIDNFFRSLARSGHSDPVAVILSGGGTDGSVGVKDIKEVGGLILVQHPQDAEYDSMPRAAIGTGLVDAILPASKLAEKLAEYVQHQPKLPNDPSQLTEADMETLQRILAQVQARTGHDFSQYKHSTILRRVERRMQLNRFVTLDAYLSFLRSNVNEGHAMFNDILIGVTNFFRDKESWEVLQQKVIPQIFRNKNLEERENGVRIWSIGCATGEEAYGLAMLLLEEAARQEVHTNIQVFASDLDVRSIAHAREGVFPAAIEADVSPERLERFFTREGDYYRVKRELRDVVLFTNHNVMRDPPFSRQDLIACRNVLIYLQSTVQDRVFDIFHYSLHPGGYLFLGTSESAEHLSELFSVIDKNHRIYQSKPWLGKLPHVPSMSMALRRGNHPPEVSIRTGMSRLVEEPIHFEEQHKRALEYYGPPSIIVNEKYWVLHISETAGRYLHLPKGPMTGDLLTLVRPELQLELRTALFHAFEKGKATASRSTVVQFNGHRRRVIVSVRPRPEVSFNGVLEKHALVLFIEDEVDTPEDLLAGPAIQSNQADRDEMVAQLQSEIQHLREQLQITIEEYDSSNEEMKTANEELQSINEEYRSTTEELETSKEELQSLNEELQTVNNEMRSKLEETSRAHRELENLMGATEIATLYLDRELRIHRFTAGVRELFHILGVDRGRLISDLTHNMGYNTFMEDAEMVQRKLIPVEREVQMADGRWFLVRMRPYRTIEDRIEGVVTSFIDINKLKETEKELLHAKETLEQRVEERTWEVQEVNLKLSQARDMFYILFSASPIPTSLLSLNKYVFLNVNEEFLTYFGLKREEIIGHSIEEFNWILGEGHYSRKNLITHARNHGQVQNFERQVRLPSNETRTLLCSIQYIQLQEEKAMEEALILTFIDITDRVRAEQQMRSLASDLTTAEQRERSRISQILHDDLQQRIFAIKVQLSILSNRLSKDNLQVADFDISQLQAMMDESIAITRNLSIDLSPAILQGDSLADALNWLSTQMKDKYGLNVTVEPNGVSTHFDDTLRILLFQAVREALFNVVKHAETHQALVSFERENGQIRLTISDDGKGFEYESISHDVAGLGGLMNLKHRLGLLGCTVQVDSKPGDGTRIIIMIPSKQVK